ncbi:MAG: hypothetical protein JKX83_01470 [Pseudomonadales bacterium]|nr:hypothetical protein [Pseudomonadales bacterium]
MIQLILFVQKNWVAITLFSLAGVTASSLWPAEHLPDVPGTDKLHHVIAYTILVFPTALRKPDKWVLFGLSFIVYGGAIELIQPYANRYGEWLDLLANTTGVLCGFVIAGFITWFFSGALIAAKNAR